MKPHGFEVITGESSELTMLKFKKPPTSSGGFGTHL